MDSQKQQAAERIKQANNILVTVSSNPSVDQLAACIGLTVSLNKMGKHATAVFSGEVPSTIEFLQPEKTIEKNTNSLRDFIIALDKSKADKLRYKVEDRVVKIFITPYRTSINEKDLEFSQGDFNVDVVVALGVHNQSELDQAITSHGRILHDATVVTMNVRPGGELGSINWLDPNASSLSELAVQLVDSLDKKLLDTQVATAFLTGIVAETERFSNGKTSPQTMSISAELMAAGANQQLVATKLEEPPTPPPPPSAPIATQEEGKVKEGEEPAKKPADDGTLEISHDDKEKPAEEPTPVPESEPKKAPEEEKPEEKPEESAPQPDAKEEPQPEPTPAPPPFEEKQESVAPQIHIDEHGSLTPIQNEEDFLPPKKEPPVISHHSEPPKMVLEPPTMGGQLTAAATPGAFGEPNDGLGLPQLEEAPMPGMPTSTSSTPAVGPTIMPPSPMNGDESPSGGAAPADSFIVGGSSNNIPTPQTPNQPVTLPDLSSLTPASNETLSDLERDVRSKHLDQPAATPAAPPVGPAPATPNDTMLPPLPSSDAPATPTPSLGGAGDLPSNDQLTPAPNAETTVPDVSSARDAVAQAIGSSNQPSLEPIQALNANPVDLPLGAADNPTDQSAGGIVPDMATPAAPSAPAPQMPVQSWSPGPNPTQPQTDNAQFGTPGVTLPQFGNQAPGLPGQNLQPVDPNSPPPVPPPMMPPSSPYPPQ